MAPHNEVRAASWNDSQTVGADTHIRY